MARQTLLAAAAKLLGALVVAGNLQGVWGEELLHGKGNVLEQLAGIVAAAAAGALLVGQAVVVYRDEELAVPLQADDGELAQGYKDPAAVVSHGQLAGEALAHAGGDLADVAVAAPVLAAVHQLGVQDDGVHSFYYPHQIGKAIKVYPNHRAFSGLYAHFRPY